MNSKKQAALLLGVGCLLLVIALSWKNLNRRGASIEKTETPFRAIEMTWAGLLANELKTETIPESILKLENDSLIVSFSEIEDMRKSLTFASQNKFQGTASYLQFLIAQRTNEPGEWNLAGQYAYSYAVQVQDTIRRDFLMQESVRFFDRVLETDSENKMALLYKGLALADRRETMMNAVPLLLQVVRGDSNNILANYTLGMLSLESGQLDKSLVRFEKLIYLQPSNAEYNFQAARTHELMGNKSEALKYYNRALELTKSPEIQAQLKDIINNLK